MAEETKDVKQETVDSSSPVAETALAKSAETQAEPTKAPSMLDVAKQVAAEHAKVQEPEVEKESAEESPVPERDKTEGEEEASPSPQDQTTEENEEKGPIPYERFQEVVQKRQDLESKVKDWEPMVQAQQQTNAFCQEHGITLEQFQQGMQVLALMNTDPARAREALKPLWESLGQYDGDVLPADLQARVEADELKPEAAKEIAALRAQMAAQKRRQQADQQRAAQNAQNAVNQSIADWDLAHRKSDADFHPKAGPNAVDGLWEITNDKFAALMMMRPPRTAAEAVAHCEAAYKAAKAFFSTRLTPKPVSKVLPSSRSSTSNNGPRPEKAKTMKEMVNLTAQEVARKHGINWTPRS